VKLTADEATGCRPAPSLTRVLHGGSVVSLVMVRGEGRCCVCGPAISDANPDAFRKALVFIEFDLVNLDFPVHQLVHVRNNSRTIDVHQHEARSHVVGDAAAVNAPSYISPTSLARRRNGRQGSRPTGGRFKSAPAECACGRARVD
jgi:hypothetical protein